MKGTKTLKVIIVILILCLAGAIAGGAFYLRKESGRTTFFPKSTLNGHDVSEMTPEQILATLSADYGNVTVTLNEKGKSAITGALADFGYVVDQDKLLGSIRDCLTKQSSSFMTLINSLASGNAFKVVIPFIFYEEKFNAAVNAAALPEARFASVNAQILFNEEQKEYYIQPETNGNEFEDAKLRSYVRSNLDTFVNGNHPNENLTMDFPEEIYIKPEIVSTDIAMNTQVNVYNQFCKAKVTHVFGDEKISIDWNTIQNWLTIENGEGVLDDYQMGEYINAMAAKYNTRHIDRPFMTSYGYQITVPSSENDYGYTINEDEEFRQLVADIRSNTEVEREPVYYSTNNYDNPVYLHRNGTDDLAGTYVEVCLSNQHLWYYKDYACIMDTDVVTGCVAKKAETKTGAFPLAYKESPSTLVGEDAADGYRTEVQYWMPFYEGQGLHDATWRSAFGGNIYMTSGSHGCVNMPPYAAQTVYENIEPGTAIIIYN